MKKYIYLHIFQKYRKKNSTECLHIMQCYDILLKCLVYYFNCFEFQVSEQEVQEFRSQISTANV